MRDGDWKYVASLTSIISLIDGMYATMAIPTTVSALMLSPKVRIAALDYFGRLKEGVFQKAA